MNNDNLYALFEAQFPRDLGTPFLETSGGHVYSWRDLHHASARIAGWLRSLALPSDADGTPARIAVQVEKSPESLILYLATLRAGLVYVPLNSAYQRAELEYFLGDAQPAVFVCAPERLADLGPLAAKAGVAHTVTLGERRDGTLLAAAAAHTDHYPTVARGAADLAAILYTSGTTGRSKGAMLTHGNLASNALVLDEYWGFKEERDAGGQDVLLHALPLFHVHGLFVASHAALLAGAKMLFLPKFDPREVIRLLHRSTVFMGVPTYYTRLLAEAGFDRHTCRNMRLMISGSAPLLAETHKELYRRTGNMVVERYGMSETLMLTSNPYFGIATRDRIAGSVGAPLPGTSVRVVTDEGTACAPGAIGHVQARGPSVFAGYWHMPEKNAEEFTADGYFRTGDVGNFDGPGRPENHLTLVGRSKDLIISGGYNVYPKEIEGYIDEMPGVAESAVIGLPHPDFGEAVAVVVVQKPGASVDGAQIIGRLKHLIANYKVPKRVFVVDELPRNAMGKVQKSVLRERHRAAFA
ncbi:MAG TPA: malonyl-CoA synthase [Burkholderiaceae bacterium]|nr:malonyl-CoA synthase [Burkholderiaceae bacterium]